jgi:hypothetical protein
MTKLKKIHNSWERGKIAKFTFLLGQSMRFDAVLGHLTVRLIWWYLPHNDIGTWLSREKVRTSSMSGARYRFKYPGKELELAFENVIGATAGRRIWSLKPMKVWVPKRFNAFVSRGTYRLKRLGDGESILYLQASLSVIPRSHSVGSVYSTQLWYFVSI